jgi:hypothetical protein
MQRLAGTRPRRKARCHRAVARDLLAHKRAPKSATVAAWLAEMAEAECISLLDEAVLRAMAQSCGVGW